MRTKCLTGHFFQPIKVKSLLMMGTLLIVLLEEDIMLNQLFRTFRHVTMLFLHQKATHTCLSNLSIFVSDYCGDNTMLLPQLYATRNLRQHGQHLPLHLFLCTVRRKKKHLPKPHYYFWTCPISSYRGLL